MKKYAIILLFIVSALNCMDKSDRAEIALHDCSFGHFLTKYNLPIENHSVFHIGCLTGKNSAELAQKASRVHAFDIHQDYIDIAKANHQSLNNIFFELCSSTHFDCPRSCDLAVIDYTVIYGYNDTNENRKNLFQCVNQHLSQNGEMFISIITSDNTLHPNIVTAINLAPTLHITMPDKTEDNITQHMIPSYPSIQELLILLDETGFEVITHEEQNVTVAMTKKALWSVYSNIVAQNPIFESIQQDENSKINLGLLFIQSYMSTLKKNNEGKLLEPVITTIIRARKK